MMKYIIGIVALIICFLVNRTLGIVLLIAVCAFLIYSMIPSRYASAGNKAFQNGDYDKALERYKKAYDTGRANVMIKVSYAFILMRAGDFEQAETILNAILANKNLKPEHRNIAVQYRCMVMYRTGRLEEALRDAQELFETYRNSAMYGMLGYFKILHNDPLEEVRAFCEEAYEYNSDDRDILDNLALVCYKMGDYECAKQYSDELIEKEPSFIEAYYHGALIAEKCGDIALAKEYAQNIQQCRRSAMTTISEDEICQLQSRLGISAENQE